MIQPDKILTANDSRALAYHHHLIGGEVREVGGKNVVYVPSGVEHSVKNDSGANLSLLVMMTPHPNYVTRKL